VIMGHIFRRNREVGCGDGPCRDMSEMSTSELEEKPVSS